MKQKCPTKQTGPLSVSVKLEKVQFQVICGQKQHTAAQLVNKGVLRKQN